ncbi:MAG: hypothetical protein KDA77_00315 [Planctomycetaceae bacterium]|nr:hypothetical protein [Planctomycetaceae bacterium]
MPANENRKVIITDEANRELTQLEDMTGLAAHELVRHSIVLLKLYANADQQDRQLRVVNPEKPDTDFVLLQMPILVSKRTRAKRGTKTK